MPDVGTEQPLPSVEPDSVLTPQAPSTVPSGPSMSDLAGYSGNFGSARGDQGVPSMIGDFFAGGYQYALFGPGATAAVGGGDRRFKLSENNSPFPQNRVFFNYHHFHNAVIDINGVDQNLDRFTFGLERTFWDDNLSWEVRVPFAATVAAEQTFTESDTTAAEFGNISFALKGLLYHSPSHTVSAGLGFVLPTGPDSEFFDAPPTSGPAPTTPEIIFENDALHLQPFVGVYVPRGRTFHQFFAQLDFDVNGNDVLRPSRQQAGVLQDQTLLFLDYSLGVWLYRDRCDRIIRSMAPMLELHYSTATQDQDYGPYATDPGDSDAEPVFVEDARRDVLHLTGGLYLEIGPCSSLNVAAVAPLREGSDKFFDAEFGLQYVRRY